MMVSYFSLAYHVFAPDERKSTKPEKLKQVIELSYHFVIKYFKKGKHATKNSPCLPKS